MSNPPTHLTDSTYFINYDHPAVLEFSKRNSSPEQTDKENAIQLYYAVRDGLRYDPYNISFSPDKMTASNALANGRGHCVDKAVLLAACARAVGIAARLEFADVKNHLSTDKFIELLKSDVFAFHGLTQLYIDGKWVKATPAFNIELCELFNVAPLEFDGETDSQFQEYDGTGASFMEYLHEYGTFDDHPRELMIGVMIKHYPHLFTVERIQELLYEEML